VNTVFCCNVGYSCCTVLGLSRVVDRLLHFVIVFVLLVWCPVGMYVRWCNSSGVPWGDCYFLFVALAVGLLVLFLLASKEWLLQPGVPGAWPCIIWAGGLAGGVGDVIVGSLCEAAWCGVGGSL
jgi:hypothetical protein